jgi:formate/nitrite transporter FocA (FNT family)
MDWKFYVAVFLGNIVGTLIYRLIRWYFEKKRKQ